MPMLSYAEMTEEQLKHKIKIAKMSVDYHRRLRDLEQKKLRMYSAKVNNMYRELNKRTSKPRVTIIVIIENEKEESNANIKRNRTHYRWQEAGTIESHK